MRNSVAAIVRGTPVVIMIGSTIEPTMMIAPRPGERRKQQRDDAQSHQRERERPLAAVFGGEIDDRARDAGIERHAPEQRAEDDRDVDRRERGGAAGDDRAELRDADAGRQRHRDRHQRHREQSPAAGASTSAPRKTTKTARISNRAHGAKSRRRAAAAFSSERSRRRWRDRTRRRSGSRVWRPDGSARGCVAK